MNDERKQLSNVQLNEKEMAFLEMVCNDNNITYPTNNDELITALESKIPIGVSMVVLTKYYEQEIVRMQILLRAYKVFDRQQKGKAMLKADRLKRKLNAEERQHALIAKNSAKVCWKCGIETTLYMTVGECAGYLTHVCMVCHLPDPIMVKYIKWSDSDKIVGWIDGHGLYSNVQIKAYIRDNPTIEFIESISTN